MLSHPLPKQTICLCVLCWILLLFAVLFLQSVKSFSPLFNICWCFVLYWNKTNVKIYWLVGYFLLMCQGWKRHGHSCFTVTSHEQNYEDAVMGYYCRAPLLTVENRWLIEQIFYSVLFVVTLLTLSSPLIYFCSCWQVWTGICQQFAEWEWKKQQQVLLDRPLGPGEGGRVQLASSQWLLAASHLHKLEQTPAR